MVSVNQLMSLLDNKLQNELKDNALERLGPQIFKDISGHYFEHRIGVESNQLSSLLRLLRVSD